MPDGVDITHALRDALHEYADVTFRIASTAPDDRLVPAVRAVWHALWEVGPGGEVTPSYVSDPVSAEPGTWKITVDFGHVPRDDRTRTPDLLADLLHHHEATPATLDTTHLTPEEHTLYRNPPASSPEDLPPVGEPRMRR
ncbi:hypothetical protein [Streptomyces sp. NRRL S-1868]|uniref:hypothetical protein n=1 Tax=Streptomyces sp. NRRL S-1868 TaxID=1463892 RepID=UPI0004C9E361|nr:hypothetical protein [Streptomyces sp. NRRL S-1868]